MVNFTCQFEWTVGFPDYILFSGVSVKVFLDKISIWISVYSNTLPFLMLFVIIQSLKDLNRTKRKKFLNCSFFLPHCLSWEISSHLFLPWDQVLHHQLPRFRPSNSDKITLSGFLGSSVCTEQKMELLSFYKHVSQFLILKSYLFILLVLCLSITNTLHFH